MSFLLSRLSSRLSHSLSLPRSLSLLPRLSAPSFVGVRSIVFIAENDAELRDLISKNPKKLVVVDWFANWCGPCRVIAPVLEKMSDQPENSEVLFVKADIDELPEASAEAGIQSVPTFHFLKEGKLVAVVVGGDQMRIKENIVKHK